MNDNQRPDDQTLTRLHGQVVQPMSEALVLDVNGDVLGIQYVPSDQPATFIVPDKIRGTDDDE